MLWLIYLQDISVSNTANVTYSEVYLITNLVYFLDIELNITNYKMNSSKKKLICIIFKSEKAKHIGVFHVTRNLIVKVLIYTISSAIYITKVMKFDPHFNLTLIDYYLHYFSYQSLHMLITMHYSLNKN